MDIGKKIISLREKRSWTQKELANRVNLNVSVMNRIESNESTN
ncbi:helix-turn-helix domain-containing protein [Lysinibacillus fusiformis]